MELGNIQEKLMNHGQNCRGIITKVISKNDTNISFIGRGGTQHTVQKDIVINFDTISVNEDGSGKNRPELILLAPNTFDTIFLEVTQGQCPTTVPFFELNDVGELKFDMI